MGHGEAVVQGCRFYIQRTLRGTDEGVIGVCVDASSYVTRLLDSI